MITLGVVQCNPRTAQGAFEGIGHFQMAQKTGGIGFGKGDHHFIKGAGIGRRAMINDRRHAGCAARIDLRLNPFKIANPAVLTGAVAAVLRRFRFQGLFQFGTQEFSADLHIDMIPGQGLVRVAFPIDRLLGIDLPGGHAGAPAIEFEMVAPTVETATGFKGRQQQIRQTPVAAGPQPFQHADFRTLPFEMDPGQLQLIVDPVDLAPRFFER